MGGKRDPRRRPPEVSVGTCADCGKQCYVSRKAARQAARKKHPNERMDAYLCGQYWHAGHDRRFFKALSEPEAEPLPEPARRQIADMAKRRQQ